MVDSSAPLNAAEAAFLAALDERGVRYLVVGMSAALMQGVRGSTDGIDLWFAAVGDERSAEAARSAGGFLVTRTQPPLLGGAFGERFDIVTEMSGLPDFEAEYAQGGVVDLGNAAVRVLPLERILVSKRAANREKDQLAIAQIEQTIRLLAALGAEG
ncbi:hypothetical protein BH11MYX4_BH11MYX4_56950 [soil metagenome]